jgi:hypothetical protein
MRETEAERERWRPPSSDEPQIEALAQAVLAGAQDPFAQIFAAVNAPSPAVRLDPSEDDLPEARLRFLHAYWTKLGGGKPPLARAVDPIEMRQALGQILLLDVEPSGYDFSYRVYGTDIARSAGDDWTGWTVGAMNAKTGLNLGLFYRAVYRASLLYARPIYTEHDSPPKLSTRRWRRLVLPLANEAGQIVRFLVGNLPIEPRAMTVAQIDQAIRGLGLPGDAKS